MTIYRIALQAGHASPVKWCVKEKVLLGKWCLKEKVLRGKWSAIAMLELQRRWFAGWTLQLAMPRLSSGV